MGYVFYKWQEKEETQTFSKEWAQKTEGALLMSTGYSHSLPPREIQKHRKKYKSN